jgi:hypothetical protein
MGFQLGVSKIEILAKSLIINIKGSVLQIINTV